MTVAACSKPAPAPAGKPASPAAAADTTTGRDAAKAIPAPQVAYDDSYGFTAPAASTADLLKADQAACDSAGIAQCQVVSSTIDADDISGYAEKTLELRVAPAWLKAWQGGLDGRLGQVHARMTTQKVTSEDLSLQVVDTAAHLKNEEALRDRLKDLVRTGPGKLSDLVDVETRLSQVQADIDATTSSLAVMNARINTVHVTLTYRSEAAPTADSVFAPVTQAARSSLGIAMHVVGLLIGLTAALVPVAIIAIPRGLVPAQTPSPTPGGRRAPIELIAPQGLMPYPAQVSSIFGDILRAASRSACPASVKPLRSLATPRP